MLQSNFKYPKNHLLWFMSIPSEDDAVILMSAFHPEINAWRVGFHDTS